MFPKRRIAAAWLVLSLALTGCATPRAGVRPPDPPLPEVAVTALETVLAPLRAAAPAPDGALLLGPGPDAYALRAQTAALAGRSIDLQYYIWHEDLTGRLLAHALLVAADRGVRVRILLDDVDARSKRAAINALDAHPNIAVRMFNPLKSRGAGGNVEMGLRLGSLNHRMHNKSWIVDDQIVIVGGRNIGDEYFTAASGANFADLDVALIGPVAADFVRGFERYWNDEAAIDLVTLDPDGSKDDSAPLRARLDAYVEDASDSPFARDLATQPPLAVRIASDMAWTTGARALIDDPRKIRGDADADPGVLEGLRTAFDAAQSRLLLVSPYFVPRDGGVEFLAALRRRDVSITVLTNSLAATDVAAVHAGYARSRPALLDAGVELYELRPDAERGPKLGIGGSSASLHGKAAIVDERWLFIGSFNLDPRSAVINCEQGVLLDSPELATRLSGRVGAAMRDGKNAWHVVRGADGDLEWHGRSDEPVADSDPEATTSRRFMAWLARLLPIESQL